MRALFRRIVAGPARTIGWLQIKQNATSIRELAAAIKAGPQPDPRLLPVVTNRRIDPERMAAALGVSVAEVEHRLMLRRRRTARAVYLYLSAAAAFLLVWLYEVITVPETYSGWLYVAGLLAVCAAFALSALYNALVNWQIRTRRLGTFGEFLATEESWWPS